MLCHLQIMQESLQCCAFSSSEVDKDKDKAFFPHLQEKQTQR